jgi:hypothetical protein
MAVYDHRYALVAMRQQRKSRFFDLQLSANKRMSERANEWASKRTLFNRKPITLLDLLLELTAILARVQCSAVQCSAVHTLESMCESY